MFFPSLDSLHCWVIDRFLDVDVLSLSSMPSDSTGYCTTAFLLLIFLKLKFSPRFHNFLKRKDCYLGVSPRISSFCSFRCPNIHRMWPELPPVPRCPFWSSVLPLPSAELTDTGGATPPQCSPPCFLRLKPIDFQWPHSQYKFHVSVCCYFTTATLLSPFPAGPASIPGAPPCLKAEKLQKDRKRDKLSSILPPNSFSFVISFPDDSYGGRLKNSALRGLFRCIDFLCRGFLDL